MVQERRPDCIIIAVAVLPCLVPGRDRGRHAVMEMEISSHGSWVRTNIVSTHFAKSY